MRRRRAGFTLLETILALTIAGLVATLAYASLRAALDTDQQVRRASAAVDDATRWRALVRDALRHAVAAAQPGAPALEIGRDAVEFRTTAFGTPSGTGTPWRVRIAVQDAAVVLRATDEGSGTELLARYAGVSGMTVQAQSLGVPDAWQGAWTSPSPPVAVRIDFASAEGARPPMVVALGFRP